MYAEACILDITHMECRGYPGFHFSPIVLFQVKSQVVSLDDNHSYVLQNLNSSLSEMILGQYFDSGRISLDVDRNNRS